MAASKVYGTRSKNATQIRTLDTEHQSRVLRFEANRKLMLDMEAEMTALDAEIVALELRGRGQLSDDELEQLLQKLERKRGLQAQIHRIQSREEEVEYFTNTSEILFKYYNTLESGSATATSGAVCADDRAPLGKAGRSQGQNQQRQSPNSPPNSILKWFQASASSRPDDAQRCCGGGINPACNPPACNNSTCNTPACNNSTCNNSTCNNSTPGVNGGAHKLAAKSDRATLHDKYMSRVDHTYVRSTASLQRAEDFNECWHCGSKNRTSMIQDGYVFCNECYTMEYILVDHDKPSYKDPPKEITYFAYKRINHFNEWLNTVQGKETTFIPDEVFNRILLELQIRRVTNLSDLTNEQMKNILKKFRSDGGSRYYEHIPYIIAKLNGLPTPHLPPELEERLRHMFCQIQVPFLKHACALNPTRKNFLSYSYVLNKFMQLLEKDQYLSFFPLLSILTSLGAKVQEAMPALVSSSQQQQALVALAA